jgi:putative NADH-flavin reductase
MQGKDAVISSLGLGNSLKSHNLIASVVQVLLPAMKLHQVRRLLFVSAFGVGNTYQQANFFQRLFFRVLLKDMYADKVIGDDMIRNSDLDWTIIMPVKLTNGKLTKKHIAAEKMDMKGMPIISRADTASFVLDSLEQASWIRMSPIVMKS